MKDFNLRQDVKRMTNHELIRRNSSCGDETSLDHVVDISEYVEDNQPHHNQQFVTGFMDQIEDMEWWLERQKAIINDIAEKGFTSLEDCRLLSLCADNMKFSAPYEKVDDYDRDHVWS